MRLDAFLAQKFPETSRATFQKLIESDRVKVNDAPAKSARQEIKETDDVKVHFPHQKTFAKEIKDFAQNVIYEDENVVVINKPPGILTHAKGTLADEFTVADFVRSRISNCHSGLDPESSNDCHAEPTLSSRAASRDLATESTVSLNSNVDSEHLEESNILRRFQNDNFLNSNRPGIVHRLDRATSGVMIAAKNPETAKFLTKQFQDRKAKKIYLAIVEKVPKIPAARIDLPIGRNPKKPAEFRVDSKGKSAITDYETLEIFDDNSAFVELKPLTGRTHQLRVHLAHIGAPIVGDIIYGHANKGQRMFLHASELEITIPHQPDNQRKTFTADLPKDFQSEIEKRKKSR